MRDPGSCSRSIKFSSSLSRSRHFTISRKVNEFHEAHDSQHLVDSPCGDRESISHAALEVKDLETCQYHLQHEPLHRRREHVTHSIKAPFVKQVLHDQDIHTKRATGGGVAITNFEESVDLGKTGRSLYGSGSDQFE
jgi:hypothetical protein